VDGYKVYQSYIALKAHFQEGRYDWFKYNGKIKTNYQSYERRNDKYFFEAVGRKISNKDVVPFLVANIINDDNVWIGDLIEDYDKAHKIFAKWKKKMLSLYQVYAEDLENINDFLKDKKLDINELFVYNSGHPLIFRFMIQEMIEKETFILLDDLIHFIPKMDKKINDIIWKDEINRINRYRHFIKYDESKVRSITKSILLP
jgi:hypothetical protein